MRHPMYAMTDADAWALLTRADFVQVAAASDGKPLLRALNHAVWDGALWFHGARAGEKSELAGCEAVAGATEVIARLPSWFSDPARACPATTLYRSAHVRGPVEDVTDPALKARALAALMARLQPEGRYSPLDHTSELYRKTIAGLRVMRLRPVAVTGREKLAQRWPEERRQAVLQNLWRRGAPGDLATIRTLVESEPERPLPELLRGPEVRLECAMDARDVDEAVALLAGVYWNEGVPHDVLRAAQLGSAAWVGARDVDGRLVATARAISDGGKYAWVYDVVVADSHRRVGIGRALMRLLLDHPRVRGARRVLLGTRDAQPFYAREGFVEATPSRFTTMALDRTR